MGENMNQINKIRNRLSHNKRNRILSILSGFLAVLSIILGFLIYMKKDENALFFKNNFNINLSFNRINSKIDSFFNSFFNFDFINLNEEMVSSNILYISANENNYFYCEGEQIPSLSNGVVYQVNKEENNSYTILIEYDNTLMAAYYDCYNPLVKQYDQVKKGDYLCSYVDCFKALFKKDGKVITYEQI